MCSVGCIFPIPMRAASSSSLRAFHTLTLSLSCPCRSPRNFVWTTSRRLSTLSCKKGDGTILSSPFGGTLGAGPVAALQHLEARELNLGDEEQPQNPEPEHLHLDADELKLLPSPPLYEVKELEELPEQWRRSRLAWLCKELPAHKPATLIRILNGQRKWMRQEDVTYVVVHCMRIRENDTSFRVYKWMIQQHWFQFDFALATKLADHLGKDRKFSKCRELFDQILNQGHVPSESTFHILVVAYLSAPVQGCLEEACSIYNRMIQLGGYKPRLSLHNSIFRTITSKPAGSSKYHLNQAELIFHNLVASKLEIHKEIYVGLIWLHSYQDTIDRERIAGLRAEMLEAGVEEGLDVLVSLLRVSAKEGNVEEAERTWARLVESGHQAPSQAFVYLMEVYAKAAKPMKSLEVFRGMREQLSSPSVVSYHKIIEVMSKAQEIDIAEALMKEFMESGLKPLKPSFIEVMNMYLKLNLHDKVESTFHLCVSKCTPDQTIYTIVLDSLVRSGDLEKAEETFCNMETELASGVNKRSCNILLGMYLTGGQFEKAEELYDMMCQKKYDVESPLQEKVDYIVGLKGKKVKKPIKLKLDKEQREILMGLLLGGLKIEPDEERNPIIHFDFNEKSDVHSVLKMHIHERYREWLNSSGSTSNAIDEMPHQFSTIKHPSFGFFADQFRPKGQPVVPKLIHRWLSPRVLAYWYMYGGFKASSGDILLKLKGVKLEDVERVVKALKTKSLDCRFKRKVN
ncbi:pentatricopeptide repeat-containing protein OTP51, chloroplastic isoform X2 [Aristolochia californica]|uniref:pentatricopeptide repeat-containing protein OTP51, chloroplastic isoform X2 n=1 Tax=Aristolochia californica TaxID=171875 RepID=UPI0035D96045